MKTLIVVGSSEARRSIEPHMPDGVTVANPGMSTTGWSFDLVVQLAPMLTEREREWFDKEVGTRIKPGGDLIAAWGGA